jgi:hypothetical protein
MQVFPIKNYEEFKELFVRENGTRKNGILLALWKSKEFFPYLKNAEGTPAYRMFKRTRTMAELYENMMWWLANESQGRNGIVINDRWYYNDGYEADSCRGLCEDGDTRAYRYVNSEGRVYKMKIGRLFSKIMEGNKAWNIIPPQVRTFLTEELSRNWQAYAASRLPQYKLVVDDDFARIYDSGYYWRGGFGSCMSDECNYHFYENAVKAKAARIENEDGQIIARCVIYSECKTADGRVLRLAERQYATEGNEVYKQMLVYALIEGGHIDGYKKVGADCHSPRSWMDCNHQPMNDVQFEIACVLEAGDTLSYQDSFKWYDLNKYKAYNHSGCGYTHMLDTTDEEFEGDEGNYDSWHEEYTTSDILTVYSGGREYTVAEDRADDFVWVDSDSNYHHIDDAFRCPYCNEWELCDNGYYSDITEEDYCCEDCRDEAEQDYKSNNWYYSDYDSEYYPDDSDIVEAKQWSACSKVFFDTTIYTGTLDDMLEAGEAIEVDGVYYLVSMEDYAEMIKKNN